MTFWQGFVISLLILEILTLIWAISISILPIVYNKIKSSRYTKEEFKILLNFYKEKDLNEIFRYMLESQEQNPYKIFDFLKWCVKDKEGKNIWNTTDYRIEFKLLYSTKLDEMPLYINETGNAYWISKWRLMIGK